MGLEQDGWKQAKFVANYTPQQVSERLSLRLSELGIEVSDCTSAVPLGPDAPHTTFASTFASLEQVSELSPQKLFFFMRTRENTPAFLGGTTYTYAMEMGSRERAVEFTKKMTTPIINAFHAGVNIMLPTVAAQGTADLPAHIIACMIKNKEHEFRCGLCHKPFLFKHDDMQYELKSFLASDCDHAFHPTCMKEYLSSGATACVLCGDAFPRDWVTFNKSMPIPRAQTLSSPNPSYDDYQHNDSQSKFAPPCNMSDPIDKMRTLTIL